MANNLLRPAPTNALTGANYDALERLRTFAPPAPPVPVQGRGTNPAMLTSQGASGFNEALAATLGMPVDIVNYLIGTMAQGMGPGGPLSLTNGPQPLTPTPFLGSQMLTNAAQGAGMIAPPTNDPTGQAFRTGGYLLGSATPVPMAPLATIENAAKAVPGILGAGAAYFGQKLGMGPETLGAMAPHLGTLAAPAANAALDTEMAIGANQLMRAGDMTPAVVSQTIPVPAKVRRSLYGAQFLTPAVEKGEAEFAVSAGRLGDNSVLKSNIGIGGVVFEGMGDKGQFSRIITTEPNGSTVAYHQLFKIYSAGQQGAGIAKSILSDQMSAYHTMGVSTVRLHAGLDVGGYAWAKYGFTPTADSWEEIDLFVRHRLEDYSGRMPVGSYSGIYRAVSDMLDRRDLWSISDLTMPIGKTTLGKALLLGSDWEGELSLANANAMERFNAYIKR